MVTRRLQTGRIKVSLGPWITVPRMRGRKEARGVRKSKRGPSLFELLDEKGDPGSRAVKVPSWDEPADRNEPKAADAQPDEDAAEPDFEETVPNDVAVEVDGDRIRFSLTSGTAAIALFAGLVVIVATFAWGNHRGKQADGV